MVMFSPFMAIIREALRIAEAGIPRLNQTVDLMVHFFFSLGGKNPWLSYTPVNLGGANANCAGRERPRPRRNGELAPGFFVFRESWLRTLVLDFSRGPALLGESVRGY